MGKAAKMNFYLNFDDEQEQLSEENGNPDPESKQRQLAWTREALQIQLA